MDAIHHACLFVAGALPRHHHDHDLPYGVFTRYVLNSAASWPEPMAILLMIVLSFFRRSSATASTCTSASACCRRCCRRAAKSLLGWFIELCMLATNLFMLVWGIKLVQTTWYQSIAEFPIVSVGMAYLPIPIGGALTTPVRDRALPDAQVLRRARARDRQPDLDRNRRQSMDILVLIGSFTVVCLMGMPVAYALGLAAISPRCGSAFRSKR